jgi:hypothetical protein
MVYVNYDKIPRSAPGRVYGTLNSNDSLLINVIIAKVNHDVYMLRNIHPLVHG